MDDPKFESGEWSGHEMATEVAERIRSVIAAAEAAAGAVRHEAEQQVASRRRAAEEEARRIVEDAKRDAEAMLEERLRRISELSDTIIERSDGLLSRLGRAEEVRRELQSLVDELGQTASRLAREASAEGQATPPAPAEPIAPAAVEEATESLAEPVPDREPHAAEPHAPVAEEPVAAPEEPEPEETRAEETAAEPPAEEPSEEAPPLRVAGERVDASVTELLARPAQPTRAEEDDQLLGARLVALQMAVAGGNRGEVEAHLIRAFDLPNPQSILDDVFGRGTDASKRVVWPSAADGS